MKLRLQALPELPARLAKVREKLRADVAERRLQAEALREDARRAAWAELVSAACKVLPPDLVAAALHAWPDEAVSIPPDGFTAEATRWEFRFHFDGHHPIAVLFGRQSPEAPWGLVGWSLGHLYDPLNLGDLCAFLVEIPGRHLRCPDLATALDAAQANRPADAPALPEPILCGRRRRIDDDEGD